MLSVLEGGPKTRAQIEKKLKISMRTFYRDLEVVREFEIVVATEGGKHVLKDPGWKSKLRVPDPCLTFTEAEALAKGNSSANNKIADLVSKLTK